MKKPRTAPEFTTVPRDLYYHEVAYVSRLEEAIRGVKIMANSGAFKQWDGEPWLEKINAVNLDKCEETKHGRDDYRV